MVKARSPDEKAKRLSNELYEIKQKLKASKEKPKYMR